ncbi:MAG: radical SAM family heme chaperone HemW [Clostridia bacterium]|nr:radical SAM family heme chaperone HemW [Clostridia bacterium]
MKNKLGIYIHVPFCAAKCAYCDFYSLSGQLEQRDAYVSRLMAELCQNAPQCQDYTIDTVYFGGGTPSLLGGKRIAAILQAVRAHYAVEPDAEITIEANPDSMTEAFLAVSHAAGANRLSMGIQSAQEDELKAIGRVHTFSQAQDAFFRARAAGFTNISVDLMYALPGQTMDRLGQSIGALLALQPEHVSCYGLTLEPHTPLGRKNPVLPDEDTQADMYLMLCRKMAAAGFEHYEISNFAKPGFRSQHNSRYWKQSPYLGFGPGAHGDFSGVRYEIPRDFHAWLTGDAKPELEDTQALDRAAEYIMLSLRTADGFDSQYFEQTFSQNPKPIEQALSALPKQYIRHTDSRWHLTDDGFLVSNAVILAALDAC